MKKCNQHNKQYLINITNVILPQCEIQQKKNCPNSHLLLFNLSIPIYNSVQHPYQAARPNESKIKFMNIKMASGQILNECLCMKKMKMMMFRISCVGNNHYIPIANVMQ